MSRPPPRSTRTDTLYALAPLFRSKDGVVGRTRTVARELPGFGVRANVVRPISGPSNMNIPEVYETLGYAINTLKIPALSNHWIGNSGPDGRPWNEIGRAHV